MTTGWAASRSAVINMPPEVKTTGNPPAWIARLIEA
jgi:hypothetical protein